MRLAGGTTSHVEIMDADFYRLRYQNSSAIGATLRLIVVEWLGLAGCYWSRPGPACGRGCRDRISVADGRITNDEFMRKSPRSSDPALRCDPRFLVEAIFRCSRSYLNGARCERLLPKCNRGKISWSPFVESRSFPCRCREIRRAFGWL